MTRRLGIVLLFGVSLAAACSDRGANLPVASSPSLGLEAQPQGIAVYVADVNGKTGKGTGNSAVFKMRTTAAGGGIVSCVTGTLVTPSPSPSPSPSPLRCSGTLFNEPRGLALDAQGNLYVADYLGGTSGPGNGAVYKMAFASGKWTNACVGFACGAASQTFVSPYGVAVDRDDPTNVYFTAESWSAPRSWQVYVALGGSSAAPIALPTPSGGFETLGGIAVDRHGNVFVAQSGSGGAIGTHTGAIWEYPSKGDEQWNAPVVVASGPPSGPTSGQLNGPYAVAVDGAGDLFIANTDNNDVLELRAQAHGTWGAPFCIPSAKCLTYFHKPHGLTVTGPATGPARFVYVADSNNSSIKRLSLATSAVTCVPSGQAIPEPCNGGNSWAGGAGFYLPNAVAVP